MLYTFFWFFFNYLIFLWWYSLIDNFYVVCKCGTTLNKGLFDASLTGMWCGSIGGCWPSLVLLREAYDFPSHCCPYGRDIGASEVDAKIGCGCTMPRVALLIWHQNGITIWCPNLPEAYATYWLSCSYLSMIYQNLGQQVHFFMKIYNKTHLMVWLAKVVALLLQCFHCLLYVNF